MTPVRKLIFAASASAIALGAAASAAAQTAAPAPAANHQVELQEVVVTAQRRTENLQNVPMSVSALNADTLQQKGLVNFQDLTQAVPGLLYSRSTNFNQPTIRGVGTRSANSGDEPNIATYIDGVYQPDSISSMQELSNIERVEVLKGPQGTLYGRNATGGAISIVTKDPTFTPHFDAAGTYGRYNYRKFAGSASGPLVGDWLAGSLAIAAFTDDGYIRNVRTDEMQGQASGEVARLKFLIKPRDGLTFQLNGLYTHANNNVLISAYALNGNTVTRSLYTRPALNPQGLPFDQVVGTEPWTTGTGLKPAASVIQKLVDGHFSWDLGRIGTLSGLVARGSTTGRNDSLTDASALLLSRTQYYSTTNYWDEELVLASPGDQKITYLVGLQGFQGRSAFEPLRSTTRNTTTGAFTTTLINYGQNTQAWAAFAEGTWNPIEKLYLTGGLRYSWDKKTAFNRTNTAAKTEGTNNWDNLSPRAVLRYEFGHNANVYASYSEAYKSGTFSPTTAAGATTPVNPEKIKSYEVGVKTDIGPRLRFTAAAFNYQYTDLQVSALVLGPTGASLITVQNAGKVDGYGGEATLEWLATDNLSFDTGLSLLHTKISDFPNASVQLPLPGNAGNVGGSANLEGKQLIRSPRSTFNIGAHYNRDLPIGKLEVNASAFLSGKYFADLTNRVEQPSYTVVNASATWRSPDNYYVTVFGENLTNEVYAIGHIISSFIDGTQASKPRWFGVTVGYKY